MTTVSFHMDGARIVGFDSQGHSGFAPEGEDIVCAAITSTVRLVECAVNDVLGLGAAVRVDPDRALISLKLPGGLSQTAESTCQTLLTAMMLYLSELRDEYPEHITVMEV